LPLIQWVRFVMVFSAIAVLWLAQVYATRRYEASISGKYCPPAAILARLVITANTSGEFP